jgi:hypothetical protein
MDQDGFLYADIIRDGFYNQGMKAKVDFEGNFGDIGNFQNKTILEANPSEIKPNDNYAMNQELKSSIDMFMQKIDVLSSKSLEIQENCERNYQELYVKLPPVFEKLSENRNSEISGISTLINDAMNFMNSEIQTLKINLSKEFEISKHVKVNENEQRNYIITEMQELQSLVDAKSLQI